MKYASEKELSPLPGLPTQLGAAGVYVGLLVPARRGC